MSSVRLSGKMSENALFHAVHYSKVMAVADWSPYQSKRPKPLSILCEYWWDRRGIAVATVRPHERSIAHLVVRSWRRGTPATRLTFYKIFVWNNHAVRDPEPFFVAMLYLFPACVMAMPTLRWEGPFAAESAPSGSWVDRRGIGSGTRE